MGTTTLSPADKHRTSRTSKGANKPHRNRAPRRTTVTLSPESQEIVERFKGATGVSASTAIDEIIRRSEPKPSRLKKVNGFLVLDLPDDGTKVQATVEDIKRAEDEADREYMERFMHHERVAVPRKKKKSGRR